LTLKSDWVLLKNQTGGGLLSIRARLAAWGSFKELVFWWLLLARAVLPDRWRDHGRVGLLQGVSAALEQSARRCFLTMEAQAASAKEKDSSGLSVKLGGLVL